ncbi:MAG: efflux RND transporter periplasmic adaptor subunit [Phycisphaerae bacterium]|nr:efflux RND transporter periplasmic adaptor subunit [Phycisphaerae bacterium]
MPRAISHILSRVVTVLPTAATLGVLAGVAYLGHRTGWTIPTAASVFGATPSPTDAWCKDHGNPEATCVICRGFKITPTAPTVLAAEGTLRSTEEAPVEEPATEGKPRAPVQVPSAEVLRVAGVQTTTATTRAMVEAVEANAESGYDMSHYAQVATRVPGFAALVRVQAGDRVKKGDVLALIDSAEVGKAKAELLQSAASLASRRTALDRIRKSTTEGFRNQADLIAAEAEVRESEIRLYNARQAMTSIGLRPPEFAEGTVPAERDIQFLGLPAEIVAGLDLARATANLAPVVAPLDGSVIARNVIAGDVVDPARALFVVADTARMWVTADLPPAQVAGVTLGQQMEFRPDGATGEPFVGQISWISTEVNEKTRTVQVRAEVPNPRGRLLAHAFGRASIRIQATPAALAVPEEAVQPDGERRFVFVRLNDEVYRPRLVTLGGRSNGFVEVLSGLAPGETVATAGSYLLAAQANRGKLGAGCCAND